MAAFLKAASVGDIPPGEMKSVELRHRMILICNVGGEFYAMADECTHDSAPISDGFLDDCEVICPRHGARFDIKTGNVTAPPAIAPVETYEVKIEGDDILVALD